MSTRLPDEHAFSLRMENGTFWLTMDCPYAPTDESRPCWPHGEDGEREEAPQSHCAYEGWIDALGVDEILHGELTIPLPTAHAVWNGDGLEIEIGSGE